MQVYVEICGETAREAVPVDAAEDAMDDPLGGEANQRELQIDALKNTIRQELMHPDSMIGKHASIISAFCHALEAFLQAPLPVQMATSLALIKLMSIDELFCQNNIRWVFTILQDP